MFAFNWKYISSFIRIWLTCMYHLRLNIQVMKVHRINNTKQYLRNPSVDKQVHNVMSCDKCWYNEVDMSPGGYCLGYYPGIISWASCQIRNIAACACAGNAGNVFPRRRLLRKPLVSDPSMHHGTCVTGKCSQHSRRMRIRDLTYVARGPCSWVSAPINVTNTCFGNGLSPNSL